MKIASRIREYSPISRALWLAVPLLGLPVSCTSMSLEEAVPSAAPLAAAGASQRPTSPDGYPNINVPAAAASPQLSESDRQRLTGELEGLRQRQATPPVSSAQALTEEERLRLLARSHGDRALSEIDAAGQ